MIGDRKADRDLTIVLLAEPPAILPRHAHRVDSLLGKAGIINNPGLDRPAAFNRRQNQFAYLRQHRLVGPLRLTDDKVQK